MNEKHREWPYNDQAFSRPRSRWHGPEPIAVALGVNQGNRLESLRRACLALQQHGIRPVGRSRIFETRPLPGSEGPAYLNACLTVRTSLMPHELLWRCQGIEREFGRKRERRWSARTLDIDLITYGRTQTRSARLTLPHPGWFRRDFVLWGLWDLGIWPEPGSPAMQRRQFDRWLKEAEACILSAHSWPLAGRPQEGCAS